MGGGGGEVREGAVLHMPCQSVDLLDQTRGRTSYGVYYLL